MIERTDIYIDTEFVEHGTGRDQILSFGAVREDGACLYWVFNDEAARCASSPWTDIHVKPYLRYAVGNVRAEVGSKYQFEKALELFGTQLGANPRFIADWPSDFKYLSDLVLTGPGTMVNFASIVMEVVRCEPWDDPALLVSLPFQPSQPRQHHALWDALVLRYHLTNQADFHAWECPVNLTGFSVFKGK